MSVTPSKETILKKIRKALSHSTPLPFPESEKNLPVYQPLQQDIEIEFAEQFTKLQGRFAYCIHQEELAAQLSALVTDRQWTNIYCSEEKLKQMLLKKGYSNFSDVELKDSDCSITTCELLVARTGTIVMSADQANGRTASVYAPVHICIAFTNQLVYDLKDALQVLKDKYRTNLPSLITFASGPSRTADIEKTLVVGVHGPKEVYLFLIEA
jgi:L-lactate dehydrogenase complex protein LldG